MTERTADMKSRHTLMQWFISKTASLHLSCPQQLRFGFVSPIPPYDDLRAALTTFLMMRSSNTACSASCGFSILSVHQVQ